MLCSDIQVGQVLRQERDPISPSKWRIGLERQLGLGT